MSHQAYLYSRFNLHLCHNIHTSRFSSQFHNNSTSRFSSHFCHKNGTSSQTEFFLAPATRHDSSTELLQPLIMVKTLLPTMVNKNSPSYSPWSNRTPPATCHDQTEFPQLLTMVKQNSPSYLPWSSLIELIPPATHHVRHNFPRYWPWSSLIELLQPLTMSDRTSPDTGHGLV